jgi:hypothetical protein
MDVAIVSPIQKDTALANQPIDLYTIQKPASTPTGINVIHYNELGNSQPVNKPIVQNRQPFLRFHDQEGKTETQPSGNSDGLDRATIKLKFQL